MPEQDIPDAETWERFTEAILRLRDEYPDEDDDDGLTSDAAKRLDADLRVLTALAETAATEATEAASGVGMDLTAMIMATSEAAWYVESLADGTPFSAGSAREAGFVLRGMFSHWLCTLEVVCGGEAAVTGAAEAHHQRMVEYLKGNLAELEAASLMAKSRTD